MLWILVLNCVGSSIDFLERFTMKLIVNWWRNIWLSHIKKTIINDNVGIEAIFQSQSLPPCLVLRWNIQNRSQTKVSISGISGDLYREGVGWCFGTFGSDRLKEKQSGSYCPPLITVSKKSLGKDKNTESEVEVTLFPPIEFWFADIDKCDVRNTRIQIRSFWGSVDTELSNAIGIPIKNIQKVAQSYHNILIDRLKVNLKEA